MKQRLVFLLTFIFIYATPTFAQDYTPTKESVQDISRYKARLLLENSLQLLSKNFTRKNYSSTPDKMLTVSFEVRDNSFTINYTMGYPYEKDRIFTHINNYSSLEMPNIEYTKGRGNTVILLVADYRKNLKSFLIYDGDFKTCKQFVDAIFILKYKDQKKQEDDDQKELDIFSPVAQQYKSLAVKPDLNEEARRFLVQATTATEEKRYTDAINLLEKAINVDPAYPQAHFNRALLWPKFNINKAAILEMKKYLMLVPDASDARASQDKIYEWEGKINN